MKIYLRYVIASFLKYFFIIFVALECFYCAIDIFSNFSNFPKSANLQLLHIAFTLLIALNYMLPLSIVFAFVASFVNMIKSNEFVSFLALGISKNSIIKPVFFIALLISFVYIGLNFTQFAYAFVYRQSLVKPMYKFINLDEKFIKYAGKYIYMGSLNHISGEAKNIKIFDINNTQISNIISAKFGKFDEDMWILSDANITNLPTNLALGADGYKTQNFKTLSTLSGFIPKAIENIYNGELEYSALDAIDALKTFKDEGVNTNSIKATLYWMTIFPLFAPLIILILYYYLPLTTRFFNLVLMGFIFVAITLCAWGALFVLARFAQNSVILAEFAIILPIVILFLFASKLYFSHR